MILFRYENVGKPGLTSTMPRSYIMFSTGIMTLKIDKSQTVSIPVKAQMCSNIQRLLYRYAGQDSYSSFKALCLAL